ncbi:hypothetical protein BC938DRAFT_476089, partial [Jimgerdemannia flammicorona]
MDIPRSLIHCCVEIPDCQWVVGAYHFGYACRVPEADQWAAGEADAILNERALYSSEVRKQFDASRWESADMANRLIAWGVDLDLAYLRQQRRPTAKSGEGWHKVILGSYGRYLPGQIFAACVVCGLDVQLWIEGLRSEVSSQILIVRIPVLEYDLLGRLTSVKIVPDLFLDKETRDRDAPDQNDAANIGANCSPVKIVSIGFSRRSEIVAATALNDGSVALVQGIRRDLQKQIM